MTKDSFIENSVLRLQFPIESQFSTHDQFELIIVDRKMYIIASA